MSQGSLVSQGMSQHMSQHKIDFIKSYSYVGALSTEGAFWFYAKSTQRGIYGILVQLVLWVLEGALGAYWFCPAYTVF